MKNPSEPGPPSGDVDTLLQRIRTVVQARAGSEAVSATGESDSAVFEQFEAALREQARLSEAVLESVQAMGSHLNELQEHAARTEEQRARQTDYLGKQLRDLRERIVQFAGTSEQTEEQVESITARVFEIEPKIDAAIADVRTGLQSSFQSAISKELASLRAQLDAAAEQSQEQWARFAADHDELVSLRKRLEAAAEEAGQRWARFAADHDELVALRETLAVAAEESKQRWAQLAADREELAITRTAEHDATQQRTANVEAQFSHMNALLAEHGEQLRRLTERLDTEVASSLAAATEANSEAAAHVSRVEASVESMAQQIQQEFEARLTTIQQAVEARATAVEERLYDFQTQTIHDLGEAGARLMTIFDGQEAFARKEDLGSELERMNAILEERMQQLRAEISEQFANTSAPAKAEAVPPSPPRVALQYDVPKESFNYFNFEERWRGTVDEITSRQARYLDLFSDRKNVLDLGCGRGEFVKLLIDNRISARGVDGNADMVRFCVERGLPVTQADIFEYLEALPAASVDAITAFQVLEHLRPERYISLIALCAEKLQPGGLFVAETINPNCPLALSNFFLDPTHVRPLPAATLAFVCRQHGFEVEFTRYSSPVADAGVHDVLDVSGEASIDLSVYQDYAIIARNGTRTAAATTTPEP